MDKNINLYSIKFSDELDNQSKMNSEEFSKIKLKKTVTNDKSGPSINIDYKKLEEYKDQIQDAYIDTWFGKRKIKKN